MSTHTQHSPGIAPPRPRRRWPLAVAGLAAIVLGAFLVLTFVPLGSTPDGDGIGPWTLSLQKVSSRDLSELSSSGSIAGPETAPFYTSRIAVYNLSDRPVMRQVARGVAERLRQSPMVDVVDLFQPGERPPPGILLHDQYVMLELPEFAVSGWLPAERTVELKAIATLSHDAACRRMHHYSTSGDPPRLQVRHAWSLTHRSVARGYESANARFRQLTDRLTALLGDELAKSLAVHSARQSPPPPNELLAAYRSAPADLPLPADPGLDLRISGHGTVIHNQSTWAWLCTDPPRELKTLENRLAAAGWRIDRLGSGTRDTLNLYLRATREASIFEAFAASPNGADGAVGGHPALAEIVYTERMGPEELDASLRAALEAPAPIDALIAFEQLASDDLRAALLERLETAPSCRPVTMLAHARLLRRLKRDKEAMPILETGYWLATCNGQSHVTSGMETLAREILGVKTWKPDFPGRTALDRVGVRAIDVGSPVEVETGLGAPVWFYLADPAAVDGRASGLVAVTVMRSSISEGVYALRLACASSSSIAHCENTDHHPARPWHGTASQGLDKLTLTAAADELGGGRFGVELTVHSAH